jgi:hypothetical protein
LLARISASPSPSPPPRSAPGSVRPRRFATTGRRVGSCMPLGSCRPPQCRGWTPRPHAQHRAGPTAPPAARGQSQQIQSLASLRDAREAAGWQRPQPGHHSRLDRRGVLAGRVVRRSPVPAYRRRGDGEARRAPQRPLTAVLRRSQHLRGLPPCRSPAFSTIRRKLTGTGHGMSPGRDRPFSPHPSPGVAFPHLHQLSDSTGNRMFTGQIVSEAPRLRARTRKRAQARIADTIARRGHVVLLDLSRSIGDAGRPILHQDGEVKTAPRLG